MTGSKKGIKIVVKLHKKNHVVEKLMSDSQAWQKLYSKLENKKVSKWSIKVEYGQGKNSIGQKTIFSNEGEYDNLRDAKSALKAFMQI